MINALLIVLVILSLLVVAPCSAVTAYCMVRLVAGSGELHRDSHKKEKETEEEAAARREAEAQGKLLAEYMNNILSYRVGDSR